MKKRSKTASPSQSTRNLAITKQSSSEKIAKEKRRRVRILKMQNSTRASMNEFKSRYHVKECKPLYMRPSDDNLTIDEKFKKMALASRAKFYLKNKNGDYNQRLAFKGQMSELRYVPLKETSDGVQLDNIK